MPQSARLLILLIGTILIPLGCIWIPGCEHLQAEEPRRHALLVGCSDYLKNEDIVALRGPTNDVQLFRDLLVDRFEFDPDRDRMVVLSASEDAAHQPTRHHIEREFLELCDSVGKGDQVVVLLCGHGSQQPDNDPENPDDVETDGLDEIFLPADIESWDGEQGHVKNAIVDDELRRWRSTMTAKGAFVWFIMDACHSGSGVRGSDAEISRQVRAESLIPEEALIEAESKAPHEKPDEEALSDGPGGWVALYAAQPHETTPETRFPREAEPDQRKYYGLLTYTINEILQNTSRSLTYNELAQAVQSRYVMKGRRTPTPLIEGSHRDQLVMGRQSFPDRSRIILSRQRNQPLQLNAGAIQGITKNSVLAVYPPLGSDDADKAVGHVLVTRVEMTAADVEPCAFADLDAPTSDQLPNQARCKVVFRDYGDSRLRVAIDRADNEGNPIAKSLRSSLMGELDSVKSNTVAIVGPDEDTDWLIRYTDEKLYLVPTEGISDDSVQGHRQSFVPREIEDGWTEYVIKDLEKIARAEGLLRLTGARTGEVSRGSSVGIEISILNANGVPIPWDSDGLSFRDGDGLTVRMKNSGRRRIDITLLYIDSAYGIDCLYPEPGEFNRLDPNGRLEIPLRLNASTTGIENLVAIVVAEQGQPIDFAFLAQNRLALARLRGNQAESPLERLCRYAIDGKGTTRGVGRVASQSYDIKTVTWRVIP